MQYPIATLVSGERVSLNLESACFSKQTLVRMGPGLIVGIVSEDDGQPWQAIYLWKIGPDGVYRYSHDIVIPNEDVPGFSLAEAYLRSTRVPIDFQVG